MEQFENTQPENQGDHAEPGPDRIYAFSDGVFAIIITIMVLELKKPEEATFYALGKLWATWLSYGVSYIFIAIVWMNHHYLLKHIRAVNLRLMWANFAHLFCVSLIPFLTEWIAETKLESVPVMLYALTFLLVNLTYYWLVWESLPTGKKLRRGLTSKIHLRSFLTLSLFLIATVISNWLPKPGFVLILCCLMLYIRPELDETKGQVLKPKRDKKHIN